MRETGVAIVDETVRLKLVPSGEYLKLQCAARPKTASDRQEQRDQDGNHRHEAYPEKPRTSMAATRKGFSVGTLGRNRYSTTT